MVPLWGNEGRIESLLAELPDGPVVIDVTGQPGSPLARFGAAVTDQLRAGGRPVELVTGANDADVVSLGSAIATLVGASNGVLVLTRDPHPNATIDQVHRNTALTSIEITLAPPTIDDVANALDLERDAAAALHQAGDGSDDGLVEMLGSLSDTEDLADLEGVLRRMAAAPDAATSDDADQVFEMVAVASQPVRTDLLASATGIDGRTVLTAVEELAGLGLVDDGSSGVTLSDRPQAQRRARSLSSSRRAAASRALGTALADAGQSEAADAFARGGDWDRALELYLARFESEGGGYVATNALAAVEHGASVADATRGRLLLARASDLRFSALSAQARADLEEAVQLLDGEPRIDALGFLAAVLDDQQRPQEADVIVAMAEYEAAKGGYDAKLGSLLSLRARITARLGFSEESDATLTRAGELIELHGTSRQQRNARNNRAWIAFDRGHVGSAEQLFAELIAEGGDVTTESDATAWHGRSLAGRGWFSDARNAFERVRGAADDPSTAGAQFLTTIGEHELAMKAGRPGDALEATDRERAYVAFSLPAWENGTSYRRADALRGLRRYDEAGAAVTASIAASGDDANGRRWRLRGEVLRMRIAYETDGTFDQRAAEDLTDQLLHAEWYSGAVELLTLRAAATSDADLSRQAVTLAMELGDPTAAAGAVAAAGDWADHSAVARAVQQLDGRMGEDDREAWSAQPGIADALVLELSDDVAEPDWHADLRTWLDDAGLGDARISPSQRQTTGLVRRTREPRGWGLVALASGIAAAIAVTLVVLLVPGDDPTPPTTAATEATTVPTTPPPETTTTTIRTEDLLRALPENGLFGTAALLGGPDNNNLSETQGPSDFGGHYWRYNGVSTVRAQPIVQDRVLYVADREGVIHVVSLDDGSATTFRMDDDIAAPLAIDKLALGEGGSTVTRGYAVDVSGNAIAFDAGRVLSPVPFEIGARVDAAPIVVKDGDGLAVGVVFATRDGRVLMLDVDLTTVLASYPPVDNPEDETLGGIQHTPALHDGQLFIADAEGELTVLDAQTLTKVCSRSLFEPTTAAPVVAESRVWVPASNLIEIYQLDCRPVPEGERFSVPALAITSPVVIGTDMYLTDGPVAYLEDLLSTANPLDGESSAYWTYEASADITVPLTVAGGVMYVADENFVVAVDGGGVVLSRFDMDGAVRVPIIVLDEVVIAVTDDQIVAIAP